MPMLKTLALASPRSLSLVPLLSLPAVAGALVLMIAPQLAVGRWAVVLSSMAFAWYLLGGLVSLRVLRRALAVRRTVAALTPGLMDRRDAAWLLDGDGVVQAQNMAAADCCGDLLGRPLGAGFLRQMAAPAVDLALMLRRAGLSQAGVAALADGRQLQAWRVLGNDLYRVTLSRPAEPRREVDEFDAIPVALLHLSADGAIRRANQAAIHLLGDIRSGQPVSALLDGPGRPIADWLGDVISGRSSGRAEVLSRRGAGHDQHLRLGLSAYGDGLLAVLSDASELKTLEAQFVQSQKMQAIGQLAGGVAHDFNNLLTAITGHCDLLMLRHDRHDPDYADLDQISQNANRAASLVGQLLAFSRKQTLSPTTLDLRDSLSDLTHLLNRLIGEKISLTLEHDPALSPIRADKRQLEQVLMNLVVNARDAMADGGQITITTRNLTLTSDDRRGPVSLPAGDYVQVSVADEGCGIPPEMMGKIFEPFFTTKRVGQGTGLGLSTAYGIIKQTGGYIFCDSQPGQGTRFDLVFPAQKPDMVRAAGDEVAQARVQTMDQPVSAQLLLVEDEAPVRAFAARALRLRGYKVVEADCAETALEMLQQPDLHIDGFLTDVVMPGMDGPSWVRQALVTRPDTPVIFMSGYAEDVFASDHDDQIESAFLPKPFSLSDLVSAVDRHIGCRD
ncbi:hybrid sensor histidine kinase/response regulator [Paracoccus jiaweipingae]